MATLADRFSPDVGAGDWVGDCTYRAIVAVGTANEQFWRFAADLVVGVVAAFAKLVGINANAVGVGDNGRISGHDSHMAGSFLQK